MSFNIALSGLAASQKDLDVTANNIANVKTIGFKQSRAEFADVYASSIFSNNRTKTGDGALTSMVAQQFSQGTLDFTENSLDMAIKGNGFFTTAPSKSSQDLSYTRAGNFKLNLIAEILKETELQITGTYLARDIIPQGKVLARYSIDAGLTRKIQKGKGELFLNASDIFNTLVMRREIEGTTFSLISDDYYETQVARIGYLYRF